MRTLALTSVPGKGGVVHPARAPDMLCQQFDRRCDVLVSFFATLSRL